MPHLLGLVLLAAGGYAILRAVRREMKRVENRLSRTARDSGDPVVSLERDPETGKYRPREG